ncbi:protein O-linked-mannose beta-1,2-N-acetylglucosaminyltransferase 1-like isoform X2 [Penaeus japonicus]|uniref:protein O-linked-mannose beta-1,2-N-acetylglucosaminyltransferase 1-like isoform X2 n=1 Tax=Penaeus japonicus TaxID=27405 RepID=UPI001C710E85|nr:protein O-linked-mannose beta-1,2-N-acetylglucosaminyltransferase 1-like isoform X2 [Penaeus japonicus]
MPLSKTHRVTGIIILNLIYAGILLYVNFDTIITKENTRSVIKNLQRLKLRLEDDTSKKTSDLSDKDAETSPPSQQHPFLPSAIGPPSQDVPIPPGDSLQLATAAKRVQDAIAKEGSRLEGRREKGKMDEEDMLLEMTVNATGVTLSVDGEQVYSMLNKTRPWGTKTARLHAGIHLLTLHEFTGKVMRADLYMTWQPTSETQFLAELNQIQDGRLLVIMGAPQFLSDVADETLHHLVSLGSDFIDGLSTMDAWSFVFHKGGKVVSDALSTSEITPKDLPDVAPLSVAITVPRRPFRRCKWYEDEHLEQRAKFCETYEGYGDFCRCEGHPWTPDPNEGPDYPMVEEIPVAIVTSRRLPHVLRQVGQVWASPGGRHTPITLFVDGLNPEAKALGRLLNVSVVEHDNPVPLSSMSRVNAHVKFTLERVFEEYSKADKAIILEDDLDLAPDFIPFFQQTAPLLESDPNLVCVNAYNYNAFRHSAHDPARLYRVHGVPAYGWMVRRSIAREMVDLWPTVNQSVDWDLYLRIVMMGSRNLLIPEIPRTKHVGGGGVHVTGLEQALYYNKRPLNSVANVTLDVKGVEESQYMKTHTEAIKSAKVVRFQEHPCKVVPIPMQQVNRTYVVYLDQPDEGEDSNAYYVAARCLGFNDRDLHENLMLMYTAPFHGNQLYLVGCPSSPFCFTRDQKDLYRPSPDDVIYANQYPFLKEAIVSQFALRVPPLSFEDQVNLENLEIYSVRGGNGEGRDA